MIGHAKGDDGKSNRWVPPQESPAEVEADAEETGEHGPGAVRLSEG